MIDIVVDSIVFCNIFFNIMHAINILDQSCNNTNNIDNIIKICEHLRNRD